MGGMQCPGRAAEPDALRSPSQLAPHREHAWTRSLPHAPPGTCRTRLRRTSKRRARDCEYRSASRLPSRVSAPRHVGCWVERRQWIVVERLCFLLVPVNVRDPSLAWELNEIREAPKK